MSTVKAYGQFCAVARSLDVLGDRWTMLVVRELLMGPATYTELQQHLPGVATNLLADRLRALQDDGLIERASPSQVRSTYRLTPRGAALRPVVHALIRWGAPLMSRGPGTDVVDARWAVLALEALLTSTSYAGPSGRLRVHCDGADLDVVAVGQDRGVEPTSEQDADCAVTGALPAVLASAYRGRLVAGLRTRGSRRLARALLASDLAR